MTNCTKIAVKSQLVAISARQNCTELRDKNRLCKSALIERVKGDFARYGKKCSMFVEALTVHVKFHIIVFSSLKLVISSRNGRVI